MKRKILILINFILILFLIWSMEFLKDDQEPIEQKENIVNQIEKSDSYDSELTIEPIKEIKKGSVLAEVELNKIVSLKTGVNNIVGFLEYDEEIIESIEVVGLKNENKGLANWNIEINKQKDSPLYGKFCIYTFDDKIDVNQNVVKLIVKLKEDVQVNSTEIKLKEIRTSDGKSILDEEDEIIKIRVKDEVIQKNETNEEVIKENGEQEETNKNYDKEPQNKLVWQIYLIIILCIINIVLSIKSNKKIIVIILSAILILLALGINVYAKKEITDEIINNLAKKEAWLNSNKYLITDEYISRVLPKTTKEDFYKELNKSVIVETNSDLIATGMTVEARGENRKYTVSVVGDISGDGEINTIDLTQLIKHINNSSKNNLKNAKKISADIDLNKKIEKQDVIKCIEYIVYGTINVPEVKKVEAPTLIINRGTYDNELKCYIDEVEIGVKNQNTQETFYKIEGNVLEQDYKIIKNEGKIVLKKNGIYKISAYSYGEEKNRSDIVSTIIIKNTKGSASLEIEDWGYGEEPKKPIIKSEIYDEKDVTYIYEGVDNKGNKYGPTQEAPKEAGKYTLTVVLKENEYADELKVSKDFIIKEKEVSKEEVKIEILQENIVHNGNPQKPEITIVVEGEKLKEGIDYVIDYSNNVNAGTGTLTIVGTGNYDFNLESGFEIEKAKLTATYVSEIVAFGEEPKLEVKVEGFVGGETATTASGYVAPVVENANINVGEYELTPKGGNADNYEFEYVPGKLEIQEKEISIEPVIEIEKVEYTGEKQTPGVKVTVDGVELSEEDYTVEYSDNINAGKVTVKVIGKGNYKGEVETTFEIAKAKLTATYVGETVAFGEEPKLEVKVEGFIGEETVTTASGYVAPTVKNVNTNAGKYELMPEGGKADNYEFEYIPGILEIQGKELSTENVEVSVTEKVEYTGKAQTPEVNVEIDGIELAKEDYTVEYSNNVNVGTAKVKVIGKGNYKGEIETTFEITKAKLIATYESETITYGTTPKLEVKVEGFVGGETATTASGYVAPVVENANINAGEYELIPEDGEAENYEFEYVPGILKIEKAQGEGTVEIDNWTYGENPSIPSITSTTNGVENVTYSYSGKTLEDVEYGPSSSIPTLAGIYTVTTEFAETSNYNKVVKTAEFIIEPKTVVANIIANNKVYDGNCDVVTNVDITGILNIDDVEIIEDLKTVFEDSNVAENVKVIGVYKLVGQDAFNYVLQETVLTSSADILPAKLTATYEGETVEFGKQPKLEVKVEGFVAGETTATASGYIAPIAENVNTNVGEYELIPAGGQADNYEFEYVPGILKIQSKEIGTAAISIIEKVEYTGQEQVPEVRVKVNGIELKTEDYTVEYSNNVNAGTAKVRIEGKGNYIGEAETTFEITKAKLTATYVGETVAYGEEPKLEIKVEGFVGEETDETASGYIAPMVENENINAGEYELTPTGGKAENYEFEYVSGILKIQKVQGAGNVTIEDWTYGENPSTPNVTSTTNGIENVTYSYSGKTLENVEFGPSENVPTQAGNYTVTAEFAETSNYNKVADTAEFTIEPKTIEANITAKDKIYDGNSIAEIEMNLTGTVENDDVHLAVEKQASFENPKVGTDKNVSATLKLTGKDAFNYILDEANLVTKAKITKASLKAKYIDETIPYGKTPKLQVQVTGFVNGENEENAEGYVVPTVSNSNTEMGTYTLIPTGGKANNYEFEYVTGILTIDSPFSYKLEHYVEGLDGNYSLYKTDDLIGLENEQVSAEGVQIKGYELDLSNNNTVESGILANDGELVLKLYYKQVKYSINYDLNGGIVEGTNASEYTINTLDITLINPTKLGYTFKGWTGTDLAVESKNVVIAKGSIGNRSYLANWEANTDTKYLVEHYIENANGEYTKEREQQLEGTTDAEITAQDVEIIGYEVDLNNANTKQTGVILADGSLVLKLYYKAVTYTIEYNLVGGTTSASNVTEYKIFSEDIILINPTKQYNYFKGWTGTGLDGVQNNVVIPTGSVGNRSYVANWDEYTYTIKFDINGGTSGSMSDMTDIGYSSETEISANKFIREECEFVEWNTKPDGTGTAYSDKAKISKLSAIDGDVITLYAQWRDIQLPVWELSSTTNTNSEYPDYANSGETITVTFNGIDANYVSNSLKVEDIEVYAGITKITPTTKTLSVGTGITKGIQYTITLSGLKENGELILKIPANKLVDKWGNVNSQTSISTGIIIDNIAPNSPTIAMSANGGFESSDYYYQNYATYTITPGTDNKAVSAFSNMRLLAGQSSDSSIAKATYTITGEVEKTETTYSSAFEVRPSSTRGECTITAYTYDKAGNKSVGSTVSNNICGSHDQAKNSQVSAKTCTAAEVRAYNCSYCYAQNGTYSGEAAMGHSYADHSSIHKRSGGSKTVSCIRCTVTKKYSITNGTCTKWTCTCGSTGGSTSHSWGSGTVTAKATCTAAGTTKYTCSKCGGSKTESAPAKLGHSWTSSGMTRPRYKCTRCNIYSDEKV